MRQLSAKQARDHWDFLHNTESSLLFIKVQFWLRPWSLQRDLGRMCESRRECTTVSGRAVEIPAASSFWEELSFLPWLEVELGLCSGSLFDTHFGYLVELPLPQLTFPASSRPFPPCYLHFTQIIFKFLLLNKPVLSP